MFNGANFVDLQNSVINNVGRDQINYYVDQGEPGSATRPPFYRRNPPSSLDDPPSWKDGYLDPPSWAGGSGEYSQPRGPVQVPRWVFPESSANSIQRGQFDRQPPPQVQSWPIITHNRTIPANSIYTTILHAKQLPTINVLLDQALTHSNANTSPWQSPVEWVHADSEYISYVIKDISVLTGNREIERFIHTDRVIIYPRLIIYTFAHLIHCARNSRLLNKFKQNLQTWNTWDKITVIQNHQQIKDYLYDVFQNLEPPDMHPERTFENLLVYDIVGLAAHLTSIVTDDNQYKELVARRGEGAQSLVNLLQARLDFWIHPKYKARHVKTLVKLSKDSASYPDCLVLKGVDMADYPIAEGGFGDVYRGRIGNQDLAIKVLKIRKRLEMDRLRKQFSCEAVTWRQISHPNVLPFYGVYLLNDVEPPRLCLASPWMENGDMVHFLAEVAPKADCVLLSLDIAQGLEYLHHELIVHGDLKGNNILILRSGRACIADFGLAATKDSVHANMIGTTVGSVGTMRWRAPELLQHDTSNTFASDVYAFAMVCHEMFSGKYPFYNLNDYQFTFAILQGKRPSRPFLPLSEIRGLNDDVWHLMEACWSQHSGDRPTADRIVKTLCHLPNRNVDSRPPDDFDIVSSSQIWYKQKHHPFSALTPSQDDTDRMRQLKWMSADESVY